MLFTGQRKKSSHCGPLAAKSYKGVVEEAVVVVKFSCFVT